MVLYSNEIKDFLDKIYFYELSHRSDLEFPIYHYYEEKLSSIDRLPKHIPSTTFPMSRDGLFGFIIGRLEFGYLFDGTNASIEYFVNTKPQNDWFDWLIESKKQQDRIINEVINDYLKYNILNNQINGCYILYQLVPNCISLPFHITIIIKLTLSRPRSNT